MLGKDSIKFFIVLVRQFLLVSLFVMYIVVGDLDLFYDENLDYVNVFQVLGIFVILNDVLGVFYVFEFIVFEIELVQRFNQVMVNVLKGILQILGESVGFNVLYFVCLVCG